MALRFIDGFDHYTAAASALYKWTEASNCSYNKTGRRATSLAVEIPAGNNAHLRKNLDDQGTWIIGGAFFFTSASELNKLFGFIDNSGAYQASVYISATAKFILCRGDNAATLATSDSSIATNAWHYVEAKLYIHDTSGTFEVKVDGVSVVSYTGDTKGSASLSTANSLLIGYTANLRALAFKLDDFYICDGTGATNNTYLGDSRVDPLLPTGAGASQQFAGFGDVSNLYANVDDATPDGDTTYNYANTAGDTDTFVCADVTTLGATVFGVQANLISRKDDAGTRTIAAQTRIATTDYSGATLSLPDGYKDLMHVWEVNPATSTAWTEAVINGAEFGYKVVA